MNIQQIIDPLLAYTTDQRISQILSSYPEQGQPFNDISQDSIDSLRGELIRLLSEEDLAEQNGTPSNRQLAEHIHQVLIRLAEISPLNQDDFLTLDPLVGNEFLVFVSTGHQFDIFQLVQYHEQREVRRGEYRGDRIEKQLLNPLTNLPISQRDIDHIIVQFPFVGEGLVRNQIIAPLNNPPRVDEAAEQAPLPLDEGNIHEGFAPRQFGPERFFQEARLRHGRIYLPVAVAILPHALDDEPILINNRPINKVILHGPGESTLIPPTTFAQRFIHTDNASFEIWHESGASRYRRLSPFFTQGADFVLLFAELNEFINSADLLEVIHQNYAVPGNMLEPTLLKIVYEGNQALFSRLEANERLAGQGSVDRDITNQATLNILAQVNQLIQNPDALRELTEGGPQVGRENPHI